MPSSAWYSGVAPNGNCLANLLTAIRLLLVLPVAWSMARPELLPALLTLLLLVLAIITDYYDGIVARASGTASARGMLFDHGTDFVFVTSGLAGAAWAGLVHWLLPIAIVVAFTQYVVDSYFLYRAKQLRMSFLGRWNGILYFVPLIGVALTRLLPSGPVQSALIQLVYWLGLALILSTLASIFDRAIANYREQR